MKSFKLSEIAAVLGLSVPAGTDILITGVNSLTEAMPGDITFVGTDIYARELPASRAAACIVQKKIILPPDIKIPVFQVDDADLSMAKVLELFAPPIPRPNGIDPTASVSTSAQLGANVGVGPRAVIGNNVQIGDRTVIHPGVVIGDDVTIGQDTEIFPNVVIRERITIGSRVIINAGTVLGTDGFGYRWDGQKHAKIPQIGTVIIEDDVELGSCTCIDRAKYGATRIGKGTKIDNLVQIAHNVTTGPHCIMAGQVGIAGSARLGTGVILGGATAVRDHITIGDGAMAAARSAIIESVKPKEIVSGMPAFPHRQSLREQAAIRRLPEMVVQGRKIQEQMEELMKLKTQIEQFFKTQQESDSDLPL